MQSDRRVPPRSIASQGQTDIFWGQYGTAVAQKTLKPHTCLYCVACLLSFIRLCLLLFHAPSTHLCQLTSAAGGSFSLLILSVVKKIIIEKAPNTQKHYKREQNIWQCDSATNENDQALKDHFHNIYIQ